MPAKPAPSAAQLQGIEDVARGINVADLPILSDDEIRIGEAIVEACGVVMFRTRRIYAPPEPEDGYRVLVDRLWPRGLAKADAAIDLWLKEIAPSAELRAWFGHDPERWPVFQTRYREELASPERSAALDRLRRAGRERPVVTLLFGAREERHNHAVMLRALLDE